MTNPVSAAVRSDMGRVLGLSLVAGLMLAATGMLLSGARPQHPAEPPAKVADSVSRLAQLIQSGGSEGAFEHPAVPVERPLATVEEMIDRLAERLRRNPDDAEGWRMLGWSFVSTGRHAEAIEAYREAVRRWPEIAALQSALGEAMVKAGGGPVPVEARAVFERALSLDAAEPRARYYLALAKGDAGARREQLEDWLALLAESGAGDDWASDLDIRIRDLAGMLGTDVSARLSRRNGGSKR